MHQFTGDLMKDIILYGYFLIFALVFLQEVGFPNPLPNELVLLFSGYLVYLGKLNIFYALLSAFLGDVLGSAILFTVFYLFGKKIFEEKPRWIPVSEKRIAALRTMLQSKGYIGIFLGRLSPFIRGYVSVLSGLMNFSKMGFSIIATCTAIIWASFYLIIGYSIGPFWSQFSSRLSDYTLYFGFVPLSVLALYILYLLFKQLLFPSRKEDLTL